MSDNSSSHAGYQSHQMDGDAAAKTMDKGANSVMGNTEFTDGIYEASKPREEPMGEKATGTGQSAFDAQGAVGKEFTKDGSIGGTAQQIGGAFSADGAVGKQFTDQGAVGGSVQKELGGRQENNTINGGV